MAPALNEPLSPATTDKLKATTTITVPVTRSTRRQTSLKAASTPVGVAVATNSASGSGSGNKEQQQQPQKGRKTNTPTPTTTTTLTTITTRRTRARELNNSKDITNTTTIPTPTNNKIKNQQKTTTTTTTTKEESMGLTAALHNKNNNAQTTTTNKKNNNLIANKEVVQPSTTTTTTTIITPTTSKDTTQEILANLTINFEEAISAEICLRKQLLDSNLNKEVAKKTNGTEIKDILVIKGVGGGGEEVEEEEEEEQQQETQLKNQHMDELLNDNETTTTTAVTADEETKTTTTTAHVENESNKEEGEVVVNLQDEKEEEAAAECEDNLFEDALEARLSQLDGSNVVCTTTTTSNAEEEELPIVVEGGPIITTTTTTTIITTPATITTTTTSTEAEYLATIEEPLQQQQEQQQYESTNIQQQQQQQYQTHVIASGELEDQDLEEVLKALKNLDPTTAGADALCDLNALFNDVYQQMNYEDTANVAHLAPAITNAAATSPIKSNQLYESQLEIDKTQQTIQRKLDFMVRRLRKMQARHMCKHTSEELAGVFEYTVRAANNKFRACVNNADGMSVISARPLPHVWQEERECAVTMTQAHNLLRKLEVAAKAQQLSTVSTSAASTAMNASGFQLGRKPRKTSLLAVEGAQTVTDNAQLLTDDIVPTLDALAVEEMSQVAGMLQAEMRQVQQAIDSEATASSSGCESVDEMISYNNQIQQALPIEKRAAWRYARDRAAIAARWSWLLTHIADLELKIRQHTELYSEIVRKKGPVLSDDVIESINLTGTDEEIDNGACRTREAH